jgi:hypothetical protein
MQPGFTSTGDPDEASPALRLNTSGSDPLADGPRGRATLHAAGFVP